MAKTNIGVKGRLVGIYAGFGHEKLAITTAAGTGLSATVFAPAGTNAVQAAVITVETADIRYRYDGTAPTVTTGHLVASGGAIMIVGYENVNNFQAISRTDNAEINVSYER